MRRSEAGYPAQQDEITMPLYIAVIREQAGHFNVSFPDVPGLVTAGDSLDEALEEAIEALEGAGEDWTNPDGSTGLKSAAQLRGVAERSGLRRAGRRRDAGRDRVAGRG